MELDTGVESVNNSTFTRKLRALAKLQNKACVLLTECEEEYERRYGVNPSDVDDDMWIDAFHGHGFSDPTAVDAHTVDHHAVGYAGRKTYLKT